MAALGRAWHAPRGFVLDIAPAALYLTALFWLGLIPLSGLPGPDFALADKVWHLLAFAALAALLSRVALYLARPAMEAARIGALLSALLGGALELLQSLTRYRAAELADLVADVLGAGLAYLVLRALAKAAGLHDGAPAGRA